jgi:hypothetical protein
MVIRTRTECLLYFGDVSPEPEKVNLSASPELAVKPVFVTRIIDFQGS